MKIKTRKKNHKPAPDPSQPSVNPKPALCIYKTEAALVWKNKFSLAWDVRSPSRGLFLLAGVTCLRKKASGVQSTDYFHCLRSPEVKIFFSEKCHQNRFSLFSGWDKQDFIQSGMTQQHRGLQRFFPLLSKQNYYSPGNRAVQTRAPHHLAPPWNIPWKWLSLSSAASSAAGHKRCRTTESGCQLTTPESLLLS